MAETPATLDRKEQLEIKHRPKISGFEQRSLALMQRPLTLQTANLAHELDTDAKQWIDAFETETDPAKAALFQAHRVFSAFCQKMSSPAQAARDRCRDIIGRYQLQERNRIERERVEREREAREAAEALRKADVDASMAQAVAYEKAGDDYMASAKVVEATMLETAPLMRTVVAEPEPAPKIEGSSTRYELVGDIKDIAQLLKWIVSGERWDIHRELFGEPSLAGMKALLRRMCTRGPGGSIIGAPSGIQVEEKAITTNRSR